VRDDVLAGARPGEFLPHMFPIDLQNHAFFCKSGETEEEGERKKRIPSLGVQRR
jgi:hypothetical protein